MPQGLARTPSAIGFAYMGIILAEQLPIKVRGLNGVLPTADDVLPGSYPLFQTHAFAFLPEKLSAAAKAFMDFVRSPEGGQSLRTNGYLPGEGDCLTEPPNGGRHEAQAPQGVFS